MKTGEQLYQRESERPRVALKANSQCESQDLPSPEARSSWETQSEVRSFRETRCNIVDNRIPDISLSTVQEQDEQKRQTIAKLIEKFESHQYKNQFLQDMSQTLKINRFSEASQKLLEDMNQTEVFELCENTKKLQCPDCKSLTEVGIIYCRCGRNLKYNRCPEPNLDCHSIDGCIMRKNCSRGPKHGPTERQEKFFKSKDMLRKAKKREFPTILAK